MWDPEAYPSITLARLKLAPPDVVFSALREYAHGQKNEIFPSADEKLEAMLLLRNEPLIDLGLARYGLSSPVVSTLYKKAFLGSGDAEHDRGIRMSCLSGSCLGAVYFVAHATGSYPTEFERLLHEADNEELFVWLSNPTAREILQQVYNQTDKAKEISSDRLVHLVKMSANNPALNLDKSNEHGPDLTAWGIQKGILKLLQTAPADETWMRALDQLLDKLDPSCASTMNSDPQEMFARWSSVTVKNRYSQKDEDEEGWLTSLSFADEFRCQLAALYGRRFIDSKSVYAGSMDDDDIVLRCAYYGNAALTLEEMTAGYARDKDVFVFAALHNENIFLKPLLRAELEQHISDRTRYMYVNRCKQIQARYSWFDTRPVSEAGQDVLDDVVERPSPEITALAQIEAKIADLGARITAISSKSSWAFFILLAVIYYTKR